MKALVSFFGGFFHFAIHLALVLPLLGLTLIPAQSANAPTTIIVTSVPVSVAPSVAVAPATPVVSTKIIDTAAAAPMTTTGGLPDPFAGEFDYNVMFGIKKFFTTPEGYAGILFERPAQAADANHPRIFPLEVVCHATAPQDADYRMLDGNVPDMTFRIDPNNPGERCATLSLLRGSASL